MVIRVCIEPVPEAIRDGFRMVAIEWYTYTKVYYTLDTETNTTTSTSVTQEVVVDRVVSTNGLSRLTCIQGTTQCSVDTMLYASFFSSDGDVVANGLATIQLGDHIDIARTRARRMMMLRTTTNSNSNTNNNYYDRALQDTTLPATVSEEFNLPIQVKSSDGNNGGSINNNNDNDNTSWLNLSDSNNGNGGSGSKPVSIMIIILLIINILTAILLLFQHPFFKRTWFYLS
jgi:hypothetical protein